jgi:hypothetical protein
VLRWESDPIATIEQARDKSDWFQAIVMSAVQIERFGYFAIANKIQDSIKDETKTEATSLIYESLDHMYLLQIAELLLTIKAIDSKDIKIIETLNGFRNSFVHQRYERKVLKNKEAEMRYKPIVDEAIRILKNLGAETKRLP